MVKQPVAEAICLCYDNYINVAASNDESRSENFMRIVETEEIEETEPYLPNTAHFFKRRSSEYPNDPACLVDSSIITAGQMWQEAKETACGLLANGVRPGDAVGIRAAPSYEWLLLNLAIWLAGAVLVPIYETDSPIRINFIRSVTESKFLFDDEQLGCLHELRRVGKSIPVSRLETVSKNLTSQSLAVILFTSGTTGEPRGVKLTHKNLIASINSMGEEPPPYGLRYNMGMPESKSVVFLPLSHVLALTVTHAALASRGQLAFCPKIKDLIPSFQAFRPTYLVAAPRVLEKIYEGVEHNAKVLSKNAFLLPPFRQHKAEHQENTENCVTACLINCFIKK
jgi:long-chain acyl-CoA synthetase